jgi:uncharacterized protein
MKVALAGASGFVGGALARHLEQAGYEVLRLVRRPAVGPTEVAWHPSSGEIEQRERLEGAAGAVNLAGSNLAAGRWTEARREEILRSRVESTRTLVAVLAHLHRPPRVLVSASATGYYGNRGEEELTEASGPGEGYLAEVCHVWEEEARVAELVGIRTVRLRTGLVLGAGGALAKLRPLFRLGLGAPLGGGRQWVSWIALEDLIRVIRRSLEDDQLGGPVNAVAPAPVRNAGFTAALARALRRPTFAPVPACLLRAAFPGLADEVLLASARVRPRRLQEAGFLWDQADLDGALRAALAAM